MTLMESALIIAGMFLVTFSVRAILFVRADKVVMPAFIEKALKFVPVAVLTAIITPMTLMPHKELELSFTNPWLLGALAAFVIGIYKQNQLLTILVGVLVFFIAKYGFSLA